MIPGLDTVRWLQREFADGQRWIIAFSGGVDSHVLLHLLATYASQRDSTAPTLLALHVNHGLNEDADRWQAHCATVCHDLNVAFQAEKVDVNIGTRTGLERAAREARYRVFESHAGHGDLLLQAHHRDDQAETVLLRMARGSGPTGLSGIPQQRSLGRARLVRPLLDFTREALLDYAHRHGLQWVEDPSNLSANQDRNFLRHQVLPLLRQRWPDITEKLSRTAETCRDISLLTESIAQEDIQGRCGSDRFAHLYLDLDGLDAMERPRLAILLRHWLRDVAQFTPSRAQLERLQQDLIGAREDAAPRLRVGQIDLRRFRQRLYLVPEYQQIDNSLRFEVSGPGSVDLGPGGLLHLRESRGQGMRRDGRIEIRFRSGPVTCQLQGREGHHSLKRQLQDLGVPPWLRKQMPLVFVDGQLAALADLALCEGHGAGGDQDGLILEWEYPRYSNRQTSRP